MILYTVYNCDDQITGISNYIPTNLPSACRVEPINLDIDYPGPNKVYIHKNYFSSLAHKYFRIATERGNHQYLSAMHRPQNRKSIFCVGNP